MSNNKIPITDLLDNEDVFKEAKKPRKSDKKPDIIIILLVIIAIIAIVRTVLYFRTALIPINDSVIISYSSSSSEVAAVTSKVQTTSSEKPTSSEAEIEIVNINTADKDKLCTLHSIGESRALAIISYREANGSFQTIDDIKNVKGIGEKIFEGIKDNICV